jgi:nicotinic acid mononucleotide adenylyltransferase
MSFEHKYVKYRTKYLRLLRQQGGFLVPPTPLSRHLEALEKSGESDRLTSFLRLVKDRIKGLVVVGGSFNPMTKAHITICVELLRMGYGVLVVPVHESYSKRFMTKSSVRLEVIRAIVELERRQTSDSAFLFRNLFVSTVEIDQTKQIRTGETLEIIHYYLRRLGSDLLPHFFMGADNVRWLCTWKGLEKLSHYPILVSYRPGQSLMRDSALLAVYRQRQECRYREQKETLDRLASRLTFVELNVDRLVDPAIRISDLSSTLVRKAISYSRQPDESVEYNWLSSLYGYREAREFYDRLIGLYGQKESYIDSGSSLEEGSSGEAFSKPEGAESR